MDKPIVFLSHSSKNKRELVALKQLLDRKAAGFIDFFLSCDGESIPLGESWVHRINDALKKAKLMFVFVSPEALKSGWIFFEAGFAFSREISVIPMSWPGLEVNRLPAPLNLLQGHNFHSAKSLSVMIAQCNRTFQTKIAEDFTKADFQVVFGRSVDDGIEQFVDWLAWVDRIAVRVKAKLGAVKAFGELCDSKGLHYSFSTFHPSSSQERMQVAAPGITLAADDSFYEDPMRRLFRIEDDNDEATYKKPEPDQEDCEFVLSPDLLHLTAPLLDEWRSNALVELLEVTVCLSPAMRFEEEMHRLTSKIHDTGVSITRSGKFRFGSLTLSIKRKPTVQLDFEWAAPMAELPLREVLVEMVQCEVLEEEARPRRKRTPR